MTAAADGVRTTLSFSAGGIGELPATLRGGVESRLTFTVRCYEHRPGFTSLFGDTLLAQRTVVRVAFFDVLDQRFVVEQDGERTPFVDEAGFLAGFFTLRDVLLAPAAAPRQPTRGGADAFRYVAARAQYDPVRLSPPLTILTLFGVAARYTTPWVRYAVPQAEAGS